MLEMIVVMVIIMMVTAASVPSFLKFANTSRLRAAARDITTALRTARRYAITQRLEYAITIYGTGAGIERAVSFYETADAVVLKRFPPTISAARGYHGSTSFASRTFTFTPLGGCAAANTIYVVDVEGNYIPITVLGATGRVRIYDINYP